jgi:carbon-monoxide dehydrogenase medium subunit
VYLPDFDYYAPETVAEACKLMTEHKNSAPKLICGGTDLMPLIKHGVIVPGVLVSVNRIPELHKIEYVSGKGITIGSAVTLNEIVFSELLNKKYMSVSNAARSMAANQIRHIGTIGGNIVAAVPSADMPPICIALNATATIEGPDGARELPLEDVFVGPKSSCLADNELLTKITIPDGKFTGSSYHKFALRRAGALAVVGVAIAIETSGDTIKDLRVSYGAVGPTPLRGKKVEEYLIGKKISDEILEKAGDIAHDECMPITDFRASEEYRRELVRVYTKRTLKKAIENGHN